MSVYKAVSNYYIEILDYLELQKAEYKTIKNFFTQASPEKKKEFIVKLCDTILRINILFSSREKYWISKKKEQHALFAIFITIALIIGLMLYGILYMRIKKEYTFKLKDGSMNTMPVIKTFITYSCIYMVILTIFVSMITNAKKLKQLFEDEAAKTRREGQFYTKYMFEAGVTNIEVELYRLAVVSRGSMYKSDLITSDDQIEQLGCPPPNAKKEDAPMSSYYNCSTRVVNYVAAFDNMKVDLEKALTAFYNDGKGYYDIRDIYILSGPIPMLKETKRILNFYYDISLKEKQAKNDITPDDVRDKNVLQKVVIDPLSNIIYKKNVILDPDSLTKSMSNPTFSDAYTNLKKLVKNTAVYVYQVYVQIYSNQGEFDDDILLLMPNVEPFKTHASTKLSTYMNININDAPKIAEAIDNILLEFVDEYVKIYKILLQNIQGDNYIIFDKTEVTNNILLDIESITAFDATYKTRIKKQLYDIIILNVKGKLDTDVDKMNVAIDNISSELIVYNINISKYQEYILSELVKDLSAFETNSKLVLLTDTLSEIIKAVTIKQSLKTKKVEDIFINQADFDTLLGSINYHTFTNMLETEHLTLIIHKFYNKIGDSIARKDNSLENIYFGIEKNLAMWKTIIIMTTVTIILVWLNFSIGNFELAPYLYVDITKKMEDLTKVTSELREKMNSELDEKTKDTLTAAFKSKEYELTLLYREKSNRLTNWIIRFILPLFVVIFVICMLFSVYKKELAKHDFNVNLIESNTNSLKVATEELRDKISTLNLLVDVSDRRAKISTITAITKQHKHAIYDNIKTILDKYEKCNFILEAQKSKLPFPYSEIAMGGFMILVTFLCLLYTYAQLKPINRLKQIKELNKMNEESLIVDKKDLRMLKKDLEYLIACHEDDIDSVIFTLKVIFFIFIVTFLIFYSSKVVNSSSEYYAGLFNSGFYESGTCVT